MKSKQDIQEVLNNIKYKPDWTFHLLEKGDGYLLQIKFMDRDVVSGKMEMQSCRKWYLSAHSTTSEIVRTAWKAVLAAEEHEAAEKFTYKGVQVENPHLDVDDKARLISVDENREGTIGLDARQTVVGDLFPGPTMM